MGLSSGPFYLAVQDVWTNPPGFDKIAERFRTTRTRRSGAKRRTSGRPRPRAIPPSPPLSFFLLFGHLSCEGPASSDKSSAKLCHWGSIRWQSALRIEQSFSNRQSYLRGAVPFRRTRGQFRRRTLYGRSDEADVGFKCSVHPRRIGASHRDHAMLVLARHEQRLLADHELPTDRGAPGAIGAAVALTQAFQAQTPALRGIAQVSNRCAIVLEEELVVLD